MNTTLKDNVNNNFFTQRNVLTGRLHEVTALVEDYADIYLWLILLQTARPDHTYRVIVYQEGKNKSQSKSLILHEIRTKGGDCYIGCIDSDQSYMLRKYGNVLGQTMVQTPYLYHTYAYSMENLFCMPSTLSQVVASVTSLHTSFAFDDFFTTLSKKVYPVFLLDLFLRSRHSKTVLGVEKWKNILPGEKAVRAALRNNQLEGLLDDTTRKVNTFVKQLQKAPEYNVEDVVAFEVELLTDNTYVTSSNCCLFIYGHEMIEFVKALLQAVCDMEVTAEKNRIRNSSISGQIKTEKLRHIDSLQGNLSYSLRQNAGFILQNTQVYQNIKADLTAL